MSSQTAQTDASDIRRLAEVLDAIEEGRMTPYKVEDRQEGVWVLVDPEPPEQPADADESEPEPEQSDDSVDLRYVGEYELCRYDLGVVRDIVQHSRKWVTVNEVVEKRGDKRNPVAGAVTKAFKSGLLERRVREDEAYNPYEYRAVGKVRSEFSGVPVTPEGGDS